MSWTYLSASPGSSARSWVRLRVGDNSSGDQQLQDEELDALLDGEGNKFLAAAVAAETIGASVARRSDKSAGRLRISQGKQADAYFKLAKRLRIEAGMRVAPYAGGISVSEKEDVVDDSDRVEPSFKIGQMDFPGTAPAST